MSDNVKHALNQFSKHLGAVIIHKHRFFDQGKSIHWQYANGILKKLFSKLHDKYQKILQENQIYNNSTKRCIFNKLHKKEQVKH